MVVSIATAVLVVEMISGISDMRLVGRMRQRLAPPTTTSGHRRRWRTAIAVDGSRRSRRRSERTIPDRLDAVVRHLRSGATLRQSLERMGSASTDPTDRRLADDLRTGRTLRRAVARWRGTDDAPNRRLAAVAVDLAASAGGASARVLDGVAETLRDRVALDREVTALSTQARASAAVLVVAPIGFAVLAIAVDRRLLSVLVSPIGVVCLVLGVGLDIVGAVWMRRLVRTP
jgi:tight adherence protein B